MDTDGSSTVNLIKKVIYYGVGILHYEQTTIHVYVYVVVGNTYLDPIFDLNIGTQLSWWWQWW